jgi:hypothetical protein
MYVRGEALDLLFNGLCQRLTLGRHAGVNGRSHIGPPSGGGEEMRVWNRRAVRGARSNAEDIGRPDPTVVPRPLSAGIAAVSASGVS